MGLWGVKSPTLCLFLGLALGGPGDIVAKMQEDTWETITDHCAKFHADWLLSWEEIHNQTNKMIEKKLTAN